MLIGWSLDLLLGELGFQSEIPLNVLPSKRSKGQRTANSGFKWCTMSYFFTWRSVYLTLKFLANSVLEGTDSTQNNHFLSFRVAFCQLPPAVTSHKAKLFYWLQSSGTSKLPNSLSFKYSQAKHFEKKMLPKSTISLFQSHKQEKFRIRIILRITVFW